jgi:hypothetical protein
MATLAADKVRKFRNVTGAIREVPAVATDIIYRGSAVGDSSGTARPLNAGDAFLGFCIAKADNSAGSASAINVAVVPEGEVQLAVTSVASTDDIGATVYASDDDTFTLASTSNSSIGKITEWVTSTTCWVKFQAASDRSI